MPEYEPAIVQAHEETRKARDIMRAEGKDFPLLVPTTAEGIEFSGVAPSFDNPAMVRVEMAFGAILVENTNSKSRAIAFSQIKSSQPVNFAPVKNLREKRELTVRGSSGNLQIGGPYAYHPEGAMYLTWEQGGAYCFIKGVGLSEDQLLAFAESLVPLA